jgi:hypothetical protein
MQTGKTDKPVNLDKEGGAEDVPVACVAGKGQRAQPN